MGGKTGDAGCGCKVGNAIDAYALSEMNDELERRWTAEDGESVRSLTAFFNRRVLERALDRAGVSSLEPEVETTYRLLTDEEVSSGMRVTKRRQLERDSVDVDRVTAHFVSHQTLYRHLTNCLELSAPHVENGEAGASARSRLEGLKNRTRAVATDYLGRLEATGEVDHEQFRVLVDVSVTCERCGAAYTFEELLDRGGCHCESEES